MSIYIYYRTGLNKSSNTCGKRDMHKNIRMQSHKSAKALTKQKSHIKKPTQCNKQKRETIAKGLPKDKKETKKIKRAEKQMQNHQTTLLSSGLSRSMFLSSQVRKTNRKFEFQKQYVRAFWADSYINFIVSFEFQKPSKPLRKLLVQLQIQKKLQEKFGEDVEISQYAKEVRAEMESLFSIEQGIEIDINVFNQDRMSITTRQGRFSFFPLKGIAHQIFCLLSSCPKSTLLYGRSGIGKSITAILYVILANKINRYARLTHKRQVPQQYRLSKPAEKLLYLNIKQMRRSKFKEERINFLEQFTSVLWQQCQQDIPIKLKKALGENQLFLELKELCRLIKQTYGQVTIFLDHFNYVANLVRDSNKKLTELKERQEGTEPVMKIIEREISEGQFQEYTMANFYLKILATLRESKINMVYSSSVNIETNLLSNDEPQKNEPQLLIPIGQRVSKYKKVKVKYQQEDNKLAIFEELACAMEFWIQYTLNKKKSIWVSYSDSQLRTILQQNHSELVSQMAEKFIDIPCQELFHEAISRCLLLSRERELLIRQCAQIIDEVAVELSENIRCSLKRCIKNRMRLSRMANMLLMESCYLLDQDRRLEIDRASFQQEHAELNRQISWQQFKELSDKDIFLVRNDKVCCDLKPSQFRFLFKLVYYSLTLQEQRQIRIWRIIENLPTHQEESNSDCQVTDDSSTSMRTQTD